MFVCISFYTETFPQLIVDQLINPKDRSDIYINNHDAKAPSMYASTCIHGPRDLAFSKHHQFRVIVAAVVP